MFHQTALVVAAFTAVVLAQLVVATIPTADRKGSKDNPILKRYEGSFIVAYERKGFGELTLPLSPIELVTPEKRTQQNNRVYEPPNKKALEGVYTRLAYLLPAGTFPAGGGAQLSGRGQEPGRQGPLRMQGDGVRRRPGRSTGGGGGNMSLSMYLYGPERVTDAYGSNGFCALSERITDQRYTAAELPQSGAHVSVIAYTIVSPEGRDPCRAFNGRTIAVVDIVEAKEREKKMVTVDAGEMAKSIDSTGRVALYGIYFDFNKADVKPESDATLEQIAALMKKSPALKVLVVGHTDNVGSFSFNMDLSQRRAAAVVAALASRFAVGKDRLTPVGVSFASPVAPNKTDEGRAKNRRVELVDNAVASGK